MVVMAGGMAMGVAAVAFALDAPGSRPARKGERAEALYEHLVKDLDLTDQQQKEVSQVLHTYRQAADNWQQEHGQETKDLESKIQEARKAGNQDQAKALREQQAKLAESHKALLDDLFKQLGDVLTKEQMDKARPILLPRRPGPMSALNLLTLDEKQQAAVKDIADAARLDADKAADPRDRERIWKDAFEKIRTTVLNDEQRNRLESLKKDRQFEGLEKLNLSDDQKKQIADLIRQAREDAAKADKPDAKREIYKIAWKKILDEVLTADQKKQFEEWKKTFGEGLKERVKERRRGHEASSVSAGV
jgi:hypothetical protein